VARLKSCSYCGRIHKRGQQCPSKPNVRRKRDSKADRFRNTNAWKKKRNYIKQRDKHLCQVCIRNLYNTYKQYNYEDVQVHHIVPIVEDYELRLENTNLISLCRNHHELAESNQIPKKVLFNIAKEQEEKNAI
jgi:5-methylcytosine-specific restriction enzyme A